MKDYIALIGRFGLTLIFIVNGLHKALEFSDSADLISEKGFPIASVFIAGSIIIELAGGILILIGYMVKPTALIMCMYLVITTIVFHPVWGDAISFMDFVKNTAIAGGLLTLYHHGAGPKSIDSHDLWS